MTLVGAALGGVLVMRFGTLRILFLGAVLTASTNLLFAPAQRGGPQPGAADTHHLAGQPQRRHRDGCICDLSVEPHQRGLRPPSTRCSAPSCCCCPSCLQGFSGRVVELIGYSHFFIGTSLLGIPVMILIIMVAKRGSALSPETNK